MKHEVTENEVKEKACENLTKELKKIAMDFNLSGVSGINCIRNPRIKCHQKAITPSPDYTEQPSCLLGMKCSEKGSQ